MESKSEMSEQERALVSHSFLVDWTVSFLKNKDIIAKKIEKIEKNKDEFDLYLKYKDREQYIAVAPNIYNIDAILQKINNNFYFSIVTLNSEENFKAVIKNWNRLIGFKFLNIIFVNPFSSLDKRWIVFPHTHQKICDGAFLENGLKSMFGMVEPIGEAQLLARITG